MKNVILGTTALVAVTALTAGSASAAEKIKLNVGGYLQTSFIAVNYDTDTNQLPTSVRHEGEIFFTGKTTLDNGLEFGVNVQLEAYESSDQIDETFMYVEGAFGRINAGSEDSAAYLMHYAAPSPVPAWSLNSPNAGASGMTTTSTLPNEIGDKDKITYFTPRFAGFQVGASYTPDSDTETAGSVVYLPTADEGTADEAFSVAANYSNKFNSVSVNASVGYQVIKRDASSSVSTTSTTSQPLTANLVTGSTTTSGATTTVVAVVNGAVSGANTLQTVNTTVTRLLDDTEEFAAGLSVGFGGFTVGGAYKFTDNDGGDKDLERQDWTVGVTYGQGPWSVGVQYAGVSTENLQGLDSDLSAFVVGGKYNLGPGITAFGGVQYWDADNGLVGTEGKDATIFFVGTALSF